MSSPAELRRVIKCRSCGAEGVRVWREGANQFGEAIQLSGGVPLPCECEHQTPFKMCLRWVKNEILVFDERRVS